MTELTRTVQNSDTQPFGPEGLMSDVGPVCKLDQGLGPTTTTSLPCTLGLGPGGLAPPPPLP